MRKNWLIIGIILLVILLEQIISATSLFNSLEFFSYDFRAKFATDSGPFNDKFKHADKKIVIVSVDDYSTRELAAYPQLDLGSWPWRRDVWGPIVNFIEKGKPKAILFDILFNGLNEDANNDERSAGVFRKYNNIVLATSLHDTKYINDPAKGTKIVNSPYIPTPKPLRVKILDKSLNENDITYYSHDAINNIYTKYNTMGVVNKVVDWDSVLRKNQPIFKLVKNNKTYYMPSLAFAGFLKYMGEGGTITIRDHKILYKNRVIPFDDFAQTKISWHGRGFDYFYKKNSFVPISKIILSENNNKYINPGYFKDKIVIIGRTVAGTDIHHSAMGPSYAGPEANATAVDNFINDSIPNGKNVRKFISEMSFFDTYLLALILSIFIGFIGMISKNALLGFANSLAFILLYILICIFAFAYPTIRIWIPMVVPLYYLIMTSATVFAFRFQNETVKKASIMNMFGKFVSPKVLTTLLKNENNLVLKSTRKRITVMFCDIKNFTTLSEKCNPEQLVDNLNELFNEIVNVIFENNGTVDKFIGDCIMAYWGDPIASEDDAYMAVKAALEIKKKIRELAIKNKKENKIVFDVKIGINTGEALLGLSGSQKIMSYTAMGDAVNVASRLESNCSKLNRDILISKSTYDDAKSKITALEAGKISVKGRDEQIEVYEPTELKEINEEVNEAKGGENVAAANI